jgi:hypothetical protein
MAGRRISKNFDVQPALKIQPEYKSTLSLIRTSCFLEREGREVQAKYAGDDFHGLLAHPAAFRDEAELAQETVLS